jgi:hypothetical protein
VSVDSVTSSVLPLYLCIAADLTITGHNFKPGATVKVGKDLATSVTYVGVDTLIAHFTGMPSAGVNGVRQDLTVTNPDGTTTTMANAVTVQQGTCTSANTSDDCVSQCGGSGGGGGGGSSGCVAKCTKPNCVVSCDSSTCTVSCSQPACIANCNNSGCTTNCSQSKCVRGCKNTGCTANCDISSCTSYCDPGSCVSSAGVCSPPLNCIDHCSTGTPPTVPNGCAGATGSYLLTVAITWNEPLIIPWITQTPASTPYVTLKANQTIACQ